MERNKTRELDCIVYIHIERELHVNIYIAKQMNIYIFIYICIHDITWRSMCIAISQRASHLRLGLRWPAGGLFERLRESDRL